MILLTSFAHESDWGKAGRNVVEGCSCSLTCSEYDVAGMSERCSQQRASILENHISTEVKRGSKVSKNTVESREELKSRKEVKNPQSQTRRPPRNQQKG